MIKNIIIIGFLSLAVTFNSYANDSDRIDQLEKEIKEIKLRLDSLLSNPSKAQDPVASGDGWKSVMNWRKLGTGIGESEVRKVLGEPHRIDGGNIAVWHYQNGGRVHFFNGKVTQWSEPRQ